MNSRPASLAVGSSNLASFAVPMRQAASVAASVDKAVHLVAGSSEPTLCSAAAALSQEALVKPVLPVAEYFRRLGVADDRGDPVVTMSVQPERASSGVVRLCSDPAASGSSAGSIPKVQVLTAGKSVPTSSAPVIFKSAAQPQVPGMPANASATSVLKQKF